MPAIGGSIESVTLGGRLFSVAADAEAQRKLGGFENEVLANGDGSARLIKTRVPLSLAGLTIVIDDSRGDQEFLQGLANLTDYFVLLVVYASGFAYQASAQLIGENPASSQAATAAIDLMGPGEFTKQ